MDTDVFPEGLKKGSDTVLLGMGDIMVSKALEIPLTSSHRAQGNYRHCHLLAGVLAVETTTPETVEGGKTF